MVNQEADAEDIAQTEKIGLGDFVVAGVIALFVGLLQTLWQFPSILPSVWQDVAVARWVRPAAQVVPGYAVAVLQGIYAAFGQTGSDALLRMLGHVVLAGVAVCVYMVLRETLAFVMRVRPQFSPARTLVMRLAAAVGTIAFVSADPVWLSGQSFGEPLLLILLTLVTFESFFLFLRKGLIRYAYLCSLVLGVLAAESPVGLLLLPVLVALYTFVACFIPRMQSGFIRAAVLEIGKWYMSFLFIAGIVLGVTLNCWTFVSHGGLGATGITLSSLPLVYAQEYWHLLTNAASPTAWLLILGVSLLPFVVTTVLFPVAADEENFLRYTTGMVFFFCGVLAISQCGFLASLWFWTYHPVSSSFLLILCMFCGAVTLANAITVLGVDARCRDHLRLARQMFGMGDAEETTYRISRTTRLLRQLCVLALPVAILAFILPGRIKGTMRRMSQIVSDAAKVIVSEAGDSRFLFSDGTLDLAIELEAHRRGLPLKCYSLMGDDSPMAGYLRTRGISDPEDQFSFGHDVGMALRSWLRDKPGMIAQSAVMLGFDLWKRDGKALPPMGGFLSRPTGYASEAVRLGYVAVATNLAQRILAVHGRRGGIKSCSDRRLRNAFLSVQWRLARICGYRGEVDDLAGRADAAIAAVKLARQLDMANVIYRDLSETMRHRNESLLQQLTPREGLQLALVRADFTLGKVYAETIIEVDPENPDANFALGMYYQKEHQLSRAESYLTRCLIRHPREPAVYNNLAMIQIEQRRFDAAERNVKKALEILPDSDVVRGTQKELQRARAEAAKAKAAASKTRK